MLCSPMQTASARTSALLRRAVAPCVAAVRPTAAVLPTLRGGVSAPRRWHWSAGSDVHASARGPSADPAEVHKFAQMAATWWDAAGAAAPLHRMNPCRVGYIRQQAVAHFNRHHAGGRPLAGIKTLDVGCGGGLLSESLARMGADTLGLDAAAASIRVAQTHAARDPALSDHLRYTCATAESLLASGGPAQFDLICALEVVEHVKSAPEFLATLAQLLRPGGMLVVSTLNQTTKSWAMTIVAAEYILRWLPIGTHDWHKFLSPRTLAQLVEAAPTTPLPVDAHRTRPTTPLLPKLAQDDPAAESSEYHAATAAAQLSMDADSAYAHSAAAASAPHLRVTDVCGMVYNPLWGTWSLDATDLDCNYILTAVKPPEAH